MPATLLPQQPVAVVASYYYTLVASVEANNTLVLLYSSLAHPYYSQIKHSSMATHEDPAAQTPTILYFYTPLLQNPPRALR